MNRNNFSVMLRSVCEKQYNWDGAGALPVRPDALNLCKIVIGLNAYSLPLDGLPDPIVNLEADGTIEVIFQKPETSNSVSLSFLCHDTAIWFQEFDDGSIVCGKVVFLSDAEDLDGLATALDWLCSQMEKTHDSVHQL